ncbi:MAG: NAD(P)-dependent glycerol-3-phosphate dehydrogenase [Phycisphaerae bacterium]|nr:NAD(P)-dependent glycerol-3-phosphate dehydrogenase [Phycisphaerae bacterium]
MESKPRNPQPDPAPRKPRARALPDRPTVTVLGIGQMGLVCAGLLAGAEGHGPPPTARSTGLHRPVNVRMLGHSADEAAAVAQTRRSPRLPDFELPASVRVCFKPREALDGADLIVSAIPVQFIREAWTALAPHVPSRAGVVSVAKGIENDTMLRPSQIVADVLRATGRDDPDQRPRRVGVLSGPTIAAELARCLPATMIAASDDPGFAADLQRLFSASWMRIYTHTDVLGVELAGAVKNVIAIAAGILDGLQAGNNAKSALLARGLAEITRLGAAMGASPETFFGIAGVGDLATSCFSPEGRNRSCGEALGRGEKLDHYLARTPSVVEGVATTRSVVGLARKYRVDLPIVHAVHAVLFEGTDPIDAIARLMSREMKPERVG